MRHASAALVSLLMVLAACAAAPSASEPASPGGQTPVASSSDAAPSVGSGTPREGLTSDPLHALVLIDVRTGGEFTIGQLAAEQPVLLETMAIWCTNCRGQQRQVVDAHDLVAFHSISLDVDPNERPHDLAEYADREGFDWPFAVANADLARQLRDRFGAAVLNPPSMPKILFRTDGSVELIGLGTQLNAAEVAAAVGG
ncbi:MAG: hypothetical protein OEW24_01780 [Chloroflexota bacterium]|nr:hypothetical protein [Chloroflexota bacterium]